MIVSTEFYKAENYGMRSLIQGLISGARPTET